MTTTPPPPRPAAPADPIHALVELVREIRDLMRRAKTDPDALLTKDALARHLEISTKTIERHITPSVQTTRRGRARYRLADAVEQLAVHGRQDRRRRMPPTPANPDARRIEDELRRDVAKQPIRSAKRRT